MVFCQTERLSIRDVELDDCQVIAKWKNQALMKKMSIGLNTEVTYANQRTDIIKSKETNQLYFVIELKDTCKPIGYIRINWMDNEKKVGWLRFGLGEERGKGYSKEALRAVLQRLFEMGAHRFDAEIYQFNEISYRLLRSIGFSHEGTRRLAYSSEERYFDVYTMGLLKSDFVS